jgi:polar amino acid transport system substrate-binding protein
VRILLLCLAIWFAPSLHVQAQTQPLLIGAEDDWAPFSSVENGQPAGMAVDIVRAIFADANISIKLVSLPYARCMREPRSGRLAGCFDTLPDAQMLRDYLFHAKPLFSDPLLILARADRPVASVQVRDLENTSVVITHGYSYGGRI